MDTATVYSKYACQLCGSTRKLVETVIDDEFVWNESEKRFEPTKFSDEFEHTGEERCVECNTDWTGLREEKVIGQHINPTGAATGRQKSLAI
jgi:hypothetical protein